MKTATRGSIRVATLAITGLISAATLSFAQCPTSPSYSPDFSANQSCLALNARISTYPVTFSTAQTSSSTVLRLTPAVGGLANSAWYKTPQNVTSGFTTTFTFQVGHTSTYNADGFAFVIQNSGTTALGPGGCGMGFGGSSTTCANGVPGIPGSVAIEFNTYNNGSPVDPDSNNDIAIQSCPGGAANSVDVGSKCNVAYAILPGTITLTDDVVHTVTVTYAASASSTCGTSGSQSCSKLDVLIDGVDLFNGGALFDMTTVTSNTAYVGFTAGTGGGNDIQDITSWSYAPTQTQTGTVTPTQTSPTTFNYNGGFAVNNPSSGYNFSAQQTTSNQTLEMQVTAIPMTQSACNALVHQNKAFDGAECFVYQNGAGLNQDSAVLFEVTCPAAGSCGSAADPFFADLGSQFSFTCPENQPLMCPPSSSTSGGSFGLPNLTSANGLPGVGFLKGEGPSSQHPCTAGATPLFTSNQIESFALGDTSGGAKGGSGGTTSCWVMTYNTPGETPSVTVTQPANGGFYTQGQKALASYTCSAVNTNVNPASPSAVGPYLTVPAAPVGTCAATDSVGGAVANGAQFDTGTLGPHTFTAQVQDSAMNASQTVVTYTVVAAPVISGPSSALVNAGSPISAVFSATGYPVPIFTETGALPAGVSFVDNKNGTATLSGTPTANGIFPITVTAQNSQGSASLVFTLTSAANVPTASGKCNGVYDGTFNGSLTVSAGQTCVFVGGGVTGNVVENGGKVVVSNAALGGNLQINGGAFLIGPNVTVKSNFSVNDLQMSAVQSQICRTSVGGNLTVDRGGIPISIGNGTAACPGNTVTGNLTVNANTASIGIYGNRVGGNLTDSANTKPTQVFSNIISGSLTCSSNASITGGSNSATQKLGQCANF